MRQIKFRYFDRFISEMIDVISIDFKFNTLVKKRNIKSIQAKGDVINYEDETIQNFEYAYLMQFTGLHDKNGNPIYEGDIIKNSFGVIYQIKWFEYQTGFYYTTFKIETFQKKLINYTLDIDEYPIEIIGNIHSNPELLEDK